MSAPELDLMAVAGALGIEVIKMAGREHVARVPWRADSKPSLALNPEKDAWFDNARSDGGDAWRLIRRTLDVDFAGARRWAERQGLIPGSRPASASARASARAPAPAPASAPALPKTASKAQPAEPVISAWKPSGNPAAVYFYNRPDGSPSYRKLRFEHAGRKRFVFERYTAERDGWIGGKGCMENVERTLYRIEQLIPWPADAPIFIVEGEKCADALWDFGMLGTTADTGAGSWPPGFGPWFRNRNVVVLPDADDSGRAHSIIVADAVAPYARTVKILELPGLGPKQDAYDFLMTIGDAV